MPTVGMDHEARGSRRLDLELRLGQNTGGGVEAGEREAKAGGCDLTSQRLDFKTRNGYFTEFLTISRCGAEERRRSARRVSQASHSTNWGFGAHQCPCMATRASAPSHHRRKVSCDLIAIGRFEFVITGKPE